MRSDALPRRDLAAELARLRPLLRDGLEAGRGMFARRKQRPGLRGLLLYLLAAPLLPAAIVALAGGEPGPAVAAVASLGLIIAGARLNRRGMLEQLLERERRFTQATRFPFQWAAVGLVATGTALAADLAAGHTPAVAVLFGLLAGVGMVFAYRVRGLRHYVASARPTLSDPALRVAVEDAERRLLAIERSALEIGNPELERHLLRIVDEGQAILAQLAEHPARLHRVRRFFNVHLEGAERVAVAYAKAHRVLRGGVLEHKFRGVLEQIASAFRRQRRHLLENDLSELDIQIDVLRKQLQREGLS